MDIKRQNKSNFFGLMTKQFFTIAELVKQDITFQSGLTEGQVNYDENSNRSFTEGAVKVNGGSALITLKGEASTDGVKEDDWAMTKKDGTQISGKYYTLGLDVTDVMDEAAFDTLVEQLQESIADPDWTVINPCKGGKINLKVKFSGNKFDPRFNGTKVSVNSLDDINNVIMLDTPIEVKAEITTSFTFNDQKAKINIVVRSIDFPGDLVITPIFQQPVSKKKSVKKD